MDRLASLEYSLMNDIYDDMINNSALESFDELDTYFDDQISQLESYTDYSFDDALEKTEALANRVYQTNLGAFGAHTYSTPTTGKETITGASKVSKFWAFLRKLVGIIVTFFRKMGHWIASLVTKGDKRDAHLEKAEALEINRVLDTAAGRIKDMMVDVKKKTIKFTEHIRRIKDPSEIQDMLSALTDLYNGVDARNQDVATIYRNFVIEYSRVSKKLKTSAFSRDEFKPTEGEGRYAEKSAIKRRFMAKYQNEIKAYSQCFNDVADVLDQWNKRAQDLGAQYQKGVDRRAKVEARGGTPRVTEREAAIAAEYNKIGQVPAVIKSMQDALRKFNLSIFLSEDAPQSPAATTAEH